MIETLREVIQENPGFHVGWMGLVLGIIFGFVVFRSNYCAMGSISDIVTFGDYRRFRTWLLAATVAMIGTQVAHWFEMVDISRSMYLSPSLNWLGYIVGGLLFGFGMVFAGGCVSKNLVRAGSGDMRSLMVLMIVGIFAYMTIGGLLGLIRVGVFGPVTVNLEDVAMENQGIGTVLGGVIGLEGQISSHWVLAVIALAMLAYCFKDQQFRTSYSQVFSGLIIGLCVVAGWMLTGLAFDEFAEPIIAPASLTFVRPMGDTLEYLMRFTALGAPSFAVVTVVGTLLGAFVASVFSGRFRLSTFADTKDTKRNLFGAALMGIGGVLGLGCTVGQALTGVSTLALGSFLTFAAILAGGYIGVKTLTHMLMKDV